MKISEAADRCGLSIDTIRFYERSGLLPVIARDPGGRRHFRSEDVDWLILLASLRETGMPMKDMQHFAELYRQGDTSIPQRRRALERHSVHLAERRAALERCSELLTFKLKRYDQIEEGQE